VRVLQRFGYEDYPVAKLGNRMRRDFLLASRANRRKASIAAGQLEYAYRPWSKDQEPVVVNESPGRTRPLESSIDPFSILQKRFCLGNGAVTGTRMNSCRSPFWRFAPAFYHQTNGGKDNGISIKAGYGAFGREVLWR